MITKNEVLRKCDKFLLADKNRFAYRVCKVIKNGWFTDFLSSDELANLLNEVPGKHIEPTGFFSQMRVLQKEDIVIVKATGRGRGIGRKKLWGPGWLSKKNVKSRIKAKEDLPREPPFSREPQKALGKKAVFLVHGHDEAAKESVARFIEKLGLRAIILHEQPTGGSKAVIEKLEANSDVSVAVVLLTPDDLGKAKKTKNLKPRARQNVILELGYFMGKLGRGRVCALYKEDVEIPSDYQGVVYILMDSTDAWRMQLAKEIKNAGIDVDLNRL